MDKAIVRNALGGIETILSKAKRALREVEMAAFGGYDDLGSYESPEDALAFHLEQLYDHLLVILEAAQMDETRENLISKWATFKKVKDGLRRTKRFGDFDHFSSPPLEFIERLASALRMTVSGQMTSEDAWTLARLESMLKDTSALVHRRGGPIAKEADVQKIMHDYLRACFPGFTPRPQVNGAIKNFRPDCGIRRIGAAIEFKIAHTERQAVVAFSGLVEDTGGYKGSKEWTRFFAVVYQAKPFLPDSHVQNDLQRIKAGKWTVILVNGETKPKAKRRKATLTKT
jgi:hypothetical protein